MTRWTIASDRRHLLADDADAFLLADTVWAAFTSPTEEEWLDHLELRRRQGFNAVLISVLPIVHDRSEALRVPYVVGPDGLDFDGGDPDYWTRAARMLKLARERGITAVLVLLWNNYVPGTWGARVAPGHTLTEQQTTAYVTRAVRVFSEYEPIWAISGDDDLDDAAAVERYSLAARIVRAEDPEALITWHSTPKARMSSALAGSDLLDVYGVQSGHSEGWDTAPTVLAEYYAQQPTPRPVINLEPCYEGIARYFSRERYRAVDVRRASWRSIVAGAAAGLGYGAHGVWSWHRRGAAFTADAEHGTPYPHAIAASFPGAEDAAYIRRIVEGEKLYALTAAPQCLAGDRTGASAGRLPDGTIVVHAPEPFPLTVRLADARDVSVTVYDLQRRRRDAASTLAAEIVDGTGLLRIAQPEFLSDALYVIRPKE